MKGMWEMQPGTIPRLLTKVQAANWHADKTQEAPCMHLFYTVQDRLTVVGDLITYKFDQVGEFQSHQSFHYWVTANLYAGQSIYWPGMEGDLQYQRSLCSHCKVIFDTMQNWWCKLSITLPVPWSHWSWSTHSSQWWQTCCNWVHTRTCHMLITSLVGSRWLISQLTIPPVGLLPTSKGSSQSRGMGGARTTVYRKGHQPDLQQGVIIPHEVGSGCKGFLSPLPIINRKSGTGSEGGEESAERQHINKWQPKLQQDITSPSPVPEHTFTWHQQVSSAVGCRATAMERKTCCPLTPQRGQALAMHH